MDSGDAVKKIAAAIGSEWNPPSVNHSLGCLKSKLIDLLTDEETESIQNDEKDNFDVPLYGWHEGDTREKLEAEILDAGCADEIDYDRIVGWLDRQAAITEREYRKLSIAYQAQCDRKFSELQEKLDELEDENARLRSCISDDAEYSKLVMGEYRDLRAKVDELTEERDTYRDNMKSLEWRADRLEAELKDTEGQLKNQRHNALQAQDALRIRREKHEALRMEYVELKAENEQLREKLSRAYDNAHDTLRMMD